MSEELATAVEAKEGEPVSISVAERPRSFEAIMKKMDGKELTSDQFRSIVADIMNYNLSDLEIAAFLMGQEFWGMTMNEIEHLTRAMLEAGEIIDFGRPVFEKHSIGGVPGNKVSLLIVPIVASLGIFIPKTSSRSITSPSGTADTMEVLAPVEFSVDEFKEIALKAGGTIAWGGKLGLSPADDLFIQVEHPLSLDPRGQMLASIMSKKLAVGARNLVIDIPTGRGAKVETMEEADKLSHDFVDVGRRFGIRVHCGVTYGGQPIGHAVGPALEAREAMEALQGKGPSSLVEKSTSLAGILIEMAGLASKGSGKQVAERALASGRALEKMREIIGAQGGKPGVEPEEIPTGEFKLEIKAPADGYVTDVDNAAITAIARAAGAPVEKGAGLMLHWKRGSKVEKGDTLIELFAERESKLTDAHNLAMRTKPVTVEGMLLYRVPEHT